MRNGKRIERTLSNAERVRLAQLRVKIDAEKDEIITEARRHKAAHDAAVDLPRVDSDCADEFWSA